MINFKYAAVVCIFVLQACDRCMHDGPDATNDMAGHERRREPPPLPIILETLPEKLPTLTKFRVAMQPAAVIDGIVEVLSDAAVGASAQFNIDGRETGVIEVTLSTASGAEVGMDFTLYQDPTDPSIVHVVVLKAKVCNFFLKLI